MEQRATEQRVWTEAPTSATIRFGLRGYDVMLTLRGDSGAELLPKLNLALDWLDAQGATPAAGGHRGNGAKPAEAERVVCPVHNVSMTKHEKNGQVWHSHKAVDAAGAEFWCRGK